MKSVATICLSMSTFGFSAMASTVELTCYHGPLKPGRIGPDPTHHLAVANATPQVTRLGIEVLMDAESDSHGQKSDPTENHFYIGLDAKLLNIKLNKHADKYRAEWTVHKWHVVEYGVGTHPIYLRSDSCKTDEYKTVPFYLGPGTMV